jgi:hypothetical protein
MTAAQSTLAERHHLLLQAFMGMGVLPFENPWSAASIAIFPATFIFAHAVAPGAKDQERYGTSAHPSSALGVLPRRATDDLFRLQK